MCTSASVPVLVLIPAAGFNSQGCAGFNSGLLELKPAQPQGESPAFPGRVPASAHGRRRYPGLPTASAIGIAESETLPQGLARGQPNALTVVSCRPGPAPSRCCSSVPNWRPPRGRQKTDHEDPECPSRKRAAAGRGPGPTEDQHAKGWEPVMNRHRRPHSSRSTPQTSSELCGMGGGCNMQAQTQHTARVPSRFDSYLEARSGLARGAHATTFHPTRRSSRCC